MLKIPKDIIKYIIIPQLPYDKMVMFWSSCKKLYTMYTPKQRMYKLLELRYKDNAYCSICGCKSHPGSQCSSDNLYKNVNTCSLCKEYRTKPQLLAIDLLKEHPYFSCVECGKGITKNSKGCLECIFHCDNRLCHFCYETFISCSTHICKVSSKKRWLGLLHNNCYAGIFYQYKRLLYSNDRIVTITPKLKNGIEIFVYWHIVNVNTYVFDPTIANGYDVFFIVNKEAIDLNDSNLLYFNLGLVSKSGDWVDNRKI